VRVRAAVVVGACLVAGVLPVATASADLAPGATTFSGISNFGRLIAPFGSL